MQILRERGRSIFVLAVVAAMLFSAAMAFGGGAKERVSIRAASPFPVGHVCVDAAEKFKSIIEDETGGRISVIVLAGAASEEDVNIQCSEGAVDIQLTGGRPVEVFAPQYFFVNGPFVIKDYEHFLRVWNGPIGKRAKDLVLEKGNMVSLGTVYRGMRQTTSKKPINGPNDLVGLKIRLPVVETWIAVWKELGAQPVPVPLTGLYDALKTGQAEASEGDLTQISSYKLYEVQSHLALTNHLMSVGWVMANKGFYDRLSRGDQQLVAKAMEQACKFASDKLMANETKVLDDLKAKGMQVTTPDAAAIREKAKPAVEQLFKTAWPVTTWAEVLAQ